MNSDLILMDKNVSDNTEKELFKKIIEDVDFSIDWFCEYMGIKLYNYQKILLKKYILADKDNRNFYVMYPSRQCGNSFRYLAYIMSIIYKIEFEEAFRILWEETKDMNEEETNKKIDSYFDEKSEVS